MCIVKINEKIKDELCKTLSRKLYYEIHNKVNLYNLLYIFNTSINLSVYSFQYLSEDVKAKKILI